MASPTIWTPIQQGSVDVVAGATVDLYTAGASGAWIDYIDLVNLGTQAFDKVWDHDISAAAYNDETTDAGDLGTADVTIFRTDAKTQADEFYVGDGDQFGVISFVLSTVLAGATVTLDVAYYNGGWVSLTAADNDLLDNTSVLKQSGEISFTPPSDWVTVAVNASTQYWIRLMLLTADPGTAPVGSTVKKGTVGAPLVTVYQDGTALANQIVPYVEVPPGPPTNALLRTGTGWSLDATSVLKLKQNAGNLIKGYIGGTDYA